MKILITGCGYLGRVIASLLLQDGHQVAATTRSPEKTASMRRVGIEPFVADITVPESLESLPSTDAVIHAVGFDRSAGLDRRTVSVVGLSHLLNSMKDRCARFIHVSSTSVYGETQGEWVDETTDCHPQSDNGIVCFDAEKLVGDLTESSNTVTSATIIRLSGIYGPGRLLRRIEQIQTNELLAGTGDAWLNLIHVEDAARAVIAALEEPHAGKTYLISDQRPVSRLEYYSLLSRLLHANPPRFSGKDTSATRTPGRNKRCQSRRSLEQLGIQLLYPDINTGLPAALS